MRCRVCGRRDRADGSSRARRGVRGQRLLSPKGATAMKKRLILAALAFALAAGGAAVLTVHPQPAAACYGNGC